MNIIPLIIRVIYGEINLYIVHQNILRQEK